MPNNSRTFLYFIAALMFAVTVGALSLAVGSVPLSVDDVWRALFAPDNALHHDIVVVLRAPRTLAAFATGGLLAMAGALMQVLLRNPLADPYVLGVSGGASVAALLAMLLAWPMGGVTAAAFVGAMLSMLLVFGLARRRGQWEPARLLLTGVVLAAGWGAIITFLLATSPTAKLPGMLYWLMGDVSYARAPGWALAVLVFALLLLLPLGRHLNVLARGSLHAAALGVSPVMLGWAVYLIASGLTAVAVTTAGSIGFVGLIVPHMVRLLMGNDQRVVLLGSALLGGCLLMLADLVARTALAPEQLPVGAVTALLGVPVFLLLLRRGASSC